MSQKKVRLPLVRVVWLDAIFEDSDCTTDEDLKPQLVHTTGYLIREDDDRILIAQDTGDDKWCRHRYAIPKILIKSMRKYK